jgi:cysteinyl-tRNA synthetase
MSTADNGIYVLQGIVPTQIAAAPIKIKVVDLYDDNGQLFSAAQVATMKGGSVPSTVLGYFSIGEAENYRPYWSSLPSSALGPVDPDWPGDYQVAYWTDAWKAVYTNYIDQMISLGYQGAYFDVVDECETAWAKSHAPNGDPKGAMMNLIESLSAYAHAKAPDFKIWINSSGAEDLLTNQTFVSSVDGALEEELFYKDSGSPQSSADVSYNLDLLNNLAQL